MCFIKCNEFILPIVVSLSWGYYTVIVLQIDSECNVNKVLEKPGIEQFSTQHEINELK